MKSTNSNMKEYLNISFNSYADTLFGESQWCNFYEYAKQFIQECPDELQNAAMRDFVSRANPDNWLSGLRTPERKRLANELKADFSKILNTLSSIN
jgi:3'-phosphoadenosine 5'-phosphosulfate sulfotransferase (PAPS reductase)/FAD synthetase